MNVKRIFQSQLVGGIASTIGSAIVLGIGRAVIAVIQKKEIPESVASMFLFKLSIPVWSLFVAAGVIGVLFLSKSKSNKSVAAQTASTLPPMMETPTAMRRVCSLQTERASFLGEAEIGGRLFSWSYFDDTNSKPNINYSLRELCVKCTCELEQASNRYTDDDYECPNPDCGNRQRYYYGKKDVSKTEKVIRLRINNGDYKNAEQRIKALLP